MASRQTNVNKARKTLEVMGSHHQPSTGPDKTGRSRNHENRRTTAKTETTGPTLERTTTSALSRDSSTSEQTPVTPARPARPSPLVGQSPMADESLYTYLNSFRPAPPLISSAATSGRNTRSKGEYSFKDIAYPVKQWPLFTLGHCIRSFAPQLRAKATQPPVILSPQNVPEKAVSSELGVAEFLVRGLTALVNRALLDSQHGLTDRPGTEADLGNLIPDRIGRTGGQVRLTGEIKPSWNFKSWWRSEAVKSIRNREYRQVLSQVHAYMNKAQCRWGYVLTDREFVALERGPGFGDLRVAEAVQWESSDDEWNVGMAAWCLHAMACSDDWHLPTVPRPENVTTTMDPVAQAEDTVRLQEMEAGEEGKEGEDREEGEEGKEVKEWIMLRRSARIKALEERRAQRERLG